MGTLSISIVRKVEYTGRNDKTVLNQYCKSDLVIFKLEQI
jgi:hypothetical protein